MVELTLQDLQAGDAEKLLQMLDLAAQAAGVTADEYRSQLAQQLAPALFQPQFLHAELQAEISAILPPMADSLAKHADTLADSAAWQWRFAHWLHGDACYWHPAQGRVSEDFRASFRAIVKLVQAASAGVPDTQKQLLNALKEAEISSIKLRERASLLTERLCDGERGQLRLKTAEARVKDIINRHLSQRPFPSALQSHLRETLKGELQHLVLTHKNYHETSLWKLWTRLLPLLGRCFSMEGQEVEDQQLYASIPPLLEELEKSLSIATINPIAYEQWVDVLSEHLLAAIKKEPVECEIFQPLVESFPGTRVTPALMAQIDNYQVGDWFIFYGEDQQALRCQLALKDADIDQMLFVDRNGRKILSKSKKEFVACISTGIANPMRLENPWDILQSLLTPSVAQANSHINRLQAQKVAGLEAKLLQQKQAKKQAQAAATKQLQLRKEAAQKALAEARALNEAQALSMQARREESAREAAQSVELARKRAITEVNELQVGALLLLDIENSGQQVRCKLSVILTGVGKYIFVDDLGRKRAEFIRDELVDLIELARVKVIHKGNNFEDQLAKVIRGLRRDSA